MKSVSKQEKHLPWEEDPGSKRPPPCVENEGIDVNCAILEPGVGDGTGRLKLVGASMNIVLSVFVYFPCVE